MAFRKFASGADTRFYYLDLETMDFCRDSMCLIPFLPRFLAVGAGEGVIEQYYDEWFM
jgi:hypothetical protein